MQKWLGNYLVYSSVSLLQEVSWVGRWERNRRYDQFCLAGAGLALVYSCRSRCLNLAFLLCRLFSKQLGGSYPSSSLAQSSVAYKRVSWVQTLLTPHILCIFSAVLLVSNRTKGKTSTGFLFLTLAASMRMWILDLLVAGDNNTCKIFCFVWPSKEKLLW